MAADRRSPWAHTLPGADHTEDNPVERLRVAELPLEMGVPIPQGLSRPAWALPL